MANTPISPSEVTWRNGMACLEKHSPKEAIALFQRSLTLKPGQAGVIQSLNLLQRLPPPGQ